MKQKVILFGASSLGKAVYEYIRDKYNVIFFCDNDVKKWGKNFCNIKIQNPEILKQEEYQQVKIIISSMYFNEIHKQLIELKIKEENIELSDFEIKSILKEPYEDKEYRSLKNIIDNFQQGKNYNLHVMTDSVYSKKFIEFINQHFNQKEHKFVILTEFEIGLRYIENISSYYNVEVIYYNKHTELKLYFYVKNSKKLFIHYLTDYMCKFICDYEVWNETELNWKFWGGDFYNVENFNLYDDKTEKALLELGLNNLLEKKVDYKYKQYRKKAIENISYILCGFKYDYDLIIKKYKCNADYKKMFYPNPIDFERLHNAKNKSVLNLKDKYKYVFMVGNSADPGNNHLEMIEQLKIFKNEDSCIIAPLSYGIKEYADYIENEGKKVFGDKFIALREFFEPEEYYNILNEVDVCLMNHNRSQGAGNIFAILYLGKKIFMKKDNSIYDSITRFGGHIFNNIENEFNMKNIVYISKNNIYKNKEIIISNFKEQQIILDYERLFI